MTTEKTSSPRPARKKTLMLVEYSEAEIKSALYDALLSPMTPRKLRQRQMIVNLMPIISAMRNLGIEFDEITKILNSKGMSLAPTTLRIYFNQEKSKENGSALSEQAAMYKRMAEQVIASYDNVIGANTDAAVDRALAKLAQIAEEKRASMSDSMAVSIESKPATVNSKAKTGSSDEKRRRNVAPRPDPAEEPCRIGDSDKAENKSMTLDDVKAIFAEYIDLSTISKARALQEK